MEKQIVMISQKVEEFELIIMRFMKDTDLMAIVMVMDAI